MPDRSEKIERKTAQTVANRPDRNTGFIAIGRAASGISAEKPADRKPPEFEEYERWDGMS